MTSTDIPDRVLILFLAFGEEHVTSGLKVLDEIVVRMFPSTDISYFIIDNSLPVEYHRSKNGVLTIGGDNSQFEFSGWDQGIRYLDRNIKDESNSIVLFVNDTFHRRRYKDGPNFLDVFDRPIVEKKDVLRSAIGYLDDFPKDVVINNIQYRSWIRSNIFFIPFKIVKKIYPLKICFELKEIFSDLPDKFWAETDLISNNWKAYISSWLFGIQNPNYPEYSLNWLKATPFTPENRDFFRKKALCILSEHYMTASLFDMGVPIIDTNIYEKQEDRHVSAYYES